MGQETFNATGTFTAKATSTDFEFWGGGGGGANDSSAGGGGGAGGGGYAKSAVATVIGQDYSIVIGSGGSAPGGNGGDSYLGDGTLVKARGGKGTPTVGRPGKGGGFSPTNLGTTVHTGGDGAGGHSSGGGGGAGGSATASANGGNGTAGSGAFGGAGGTGEGAGGEGHTKASFPTPETVHGNAPGGGGGGDAPLSSGPGAGAIGRCVVSWVDPPVKPWWYWRCRRQS